jgi:hypothetical protein
VNFASGGLGAGHTGKLLIVKGGKKTPPEEKVFAVGGKKSPPNRPGPAGYAGVRVSANPKNG